MKLSSEEHNEKIIQKNEQILRGQLDTTKHTNICMRIPEEKKEPTTNKKSEEMAQRFPNFMKDLNLHIQEVQQIWSRKTSTRSTHYREIVEDKERIEILKEETHHIQGICSKIMSGVFIKNHRCQKAEDNILSASREKLSTNF